MYIIESTYVMDKNNSIGDKIITVVIVSILACLFTGGIAASLHLHVPTICILTIGITTVH